jgi:hypothetical protein
MRISTSTVSNTKTMVKQSLTHRRNAKELEDEEGEVMWLHLNTKTKSYIHPQIWKTFCVQASNDVDSLALRIAVLLVLATSFRSVTERRHRIALQSLARTSCGITRLYCLVLLKRQLTIPVRFSKSSDNTGKNVGFSMAKLGGT